MADVKRANYVFLPWVRQGAAAGIQTPDHLGTAAADQPGVVSVTASLSVNDAAPITRQVRLYGPGDVTGIDRQQVIRTVPRHLAQDFEPNYFPAVEFDRPDFPWLFTPAKAGEDGKLRPWLCLVVVRKQEGVTLDTDRARRLPVLTITPKELWEAELPDLADSWAWAHAQVSGNLPEADTLGKALAGDPALNLSRLLCPRRLDPLTDYLACVVPAFELGRKAGLGLPIEPADETRLDPAWPPKPPDTAVTLPVYYQWEFRTGTGGDFEALVDKLEPLEMPAEAGKRPMDISQPGFIVDPSLPEGASLELEGALRAFENPTTDWPPEARKPKFQEALAKILNAPWQVMKDGLKQGDEEPLLGPPIYGCWQAAQNTVEILPEPSSSPWLHELNLDPRHRAVAALGTQVVQLQQEQLMAAAWEQLGEIQRVNQLRRQGQLARTVNATFISRHFDRFPEETLLKVTASAQSRLVLEAAGPGGSPGSLSALQPGSASLTPGARPRELLSHRISQSALPDRAVSAPLRRLTSPRGAISARFQPATKAPIRIVEKLNSSTSIVPAQRKPAGWVTINQVSDRLGGGFNQNVCSERISSALDSARQLSKFKIAAEDDAATPLAALIDEDAQVFRAAAKAHQDTVRQRVLGILWENFQNVFSGGNDIIYGVDHRGRLLFYRDRVQEGTGEVALPSVIGQGGWLQFKFLFSGGNGDIYAVGPETPAHQPLLLYRDKNQDGTGDVANSEEIGPTKGWDVFNFLFSGGNGILYAVNKSGQLIFYRDRIKEGQGDPISNGWSDLKSIFSGGNGIIYAVDAEGRLIFFRDENQNGTRTIDFDRSRIISQGGWLPDQNFKFLFSSGNGILYAVDQEGRLLASRDERRDGTGTVALPTPIAPGGTAFPSPPMELAKTKESLLQSVDPEKTIQARVRASTRVRESTTSGSGPRQTSDPLEPLLDEPSFPQPMYAALRDLSQDFLFPGLEHVLPNTVTLLESNRQFIESFLVGLNAEMSRELLWRGFPTDQRGTYFRQFWEPVADKDQPDNDQPQNDQSDIARINEWGNTPLGQNTRSGEALVLLLRGDLLRRYPNSVIYAVEAPTQSEQLDVINGPQKELHPIFRGTLEPDITFVGFPLDRKKATGENGGPGYFIVIQEQPTEPRFGLDAADFVEDLPALATWNELSWRHLAITEEALKALSHVSTTTVLPKKTINGVEEPVKTINGVEWGKNAAHQAFITLQRPVRVAIHARELIP